MAYTMFLFLPAIGANETRTEQTTMRFAYADPPYIGQAKKHYAHDRRCGEVDHVALIERLNNYDGWALSLSSPTLKTIPPMCPDDVRVMAWVKPFCVFKVNVNPAYAWEPVIVRGGRRRTRQQGTVRDWVSAVITLRKGLVGVNRLSFPTGCSGFSNMQPEDEFDDLFPGSGAVSRAWMEWRSEFAFSEY